MPIAARDILVSEGYLPSNTISASDDMMTRKKYFLPMIQIPRETMKHENCQQET
jgi:hypothetical protein